MHPTKKRLREIAPERFYPLSVYQEGSGISPTRMREGRLQGVYLETIDVGKRKFVRGSDGIEYILQLAALGAAK